MNDNGEKLKVSWEDIESHQSKPSFETSPHNVNVNNDTRSNKFIFPCLAVVILGVLIFCVILLTNSKESTAIEHVYNQHVALTQMKSPTPSKFLAGLTRIDISACPSDFRTAFVSYIHVFRVIVSMKQERARLEQRYESGEIFLELLFAGAVGYGEEFIENEFDGFLYMLIGENSQDALWQLQQAKNNLELVCAKYGAPSSWD